MDVSKYSHGLPCWVDLVVADPARAAVFYGTLLDWHVPPGDPNYGGYANAELAGRSVAGVMPKMSPEMPAVWSAYVAVDDAEATLDVAAEAGATVITPATAVGQLGSMGVFADPTGAAIGVWQPGLHIGAQVQAEAGALCWIELATSDVAAAHAFYTKVFGWEPVPRGEDADYTLWTVRGTPVAGMMPLGDDRRDAAPHWLVYFQVADCDAAVAACAALGGELVTGPLETPGVGRLAVLTDDQAATFALIQPRPRTDAKD